MPHGKKHQEPDHKPKLRLGMSAAEFTGHYWLKQELVTFASRLDLPTYGYKPELSARIERRLRGLPDQDPPTQPTRNGQRDSDRPLTLETPVVNYKSDVKTRQFFKSILGPEFHFTYHVNQFRLANDGLTYGDLVGEWLAERERRNDPDYRAPIASHGKYNNFIRDFFADPANQGKSLAEAAVAWNGVKDRPGDPRYEPPKASR